MNDELITKTLDNYSEWALRYFNMMESKGLSLKDFKMDLEPLLRRVHNHLQARIQKMTNENKIFFVKFRFQDNQSNEEFWNLKDDTFKVRIYDIFEMLIWLWID